MTSDPRKHISTHLEAIAVETHRLMRKAARDKGMARLRRGAVDGYALPGTVASFIWAASSSIGGDEITKEDVDLVRRYLKVTGNVITMERLAERRFKIFVAGEWQVVDPELKKPRREPDAIDKRAEKLRPEEVGEDREPAPVVVVQRGPGRTYIPTERTAPLLIELAHLGEVTDSRGHATEQLIEASGVDTHPRNASNLLRKFEEEGLVTRKVKGKRTYRIEITEQGLERAILTAEMRGIPLKPRADRSHPEPSPEEQPVTAHLTRTQEAPEVDISPDLMDQVVSTVQDVIRVSVQANLNGHATEEHEQLRKDILDVLSMEALSPFAMLAQIEELVR